jgi:hypothetical protein
MFSITIGKKENNFVILTKDGRDDWEEFPPGELKKKNWIGISYCEIEYPEFIEKVFGKVDLHGDMVPLKIHIDRINKLKSRGRFSKIFDWIKATSNEAIELYGEEAYVQFD